MFKLVILCVFEPLAKMPDKEFVLPDEYEDSPHAELRAMRWLMNRPNDIVMLVEG